MDHVHGVIDTASPPIDSQERFEGLGVTVIRETCIDLPARAQVEGRSAKPLSIQSTIVSLQQAQSRFVPPIKGVGRVRPISPMKRFFNNRELPRNTSLSSAADPIGVEMAQAHRRLGAERHA